MRNSLGKGLDALFAQNGTVDTEKSVTTVRVSDIEPNKSQPRKTFDEEKIEELCASIKLHGVITPLIVRPIGNSRYQIVAGERRWRACRRAGITEVPVVIRDFDDKETAEIALIENLQREDLNIIEEAKGYEALINDFDLTQDEIAARVSKSRSAITNTLRLLKLPDEVIKMLETNTITQGHAKALLAFEKDEDILNIAGKIVEKGLTVRDVEKMSKTKKVAKEFSLDRTLYDDIQKTLSSTLGRKVLIHPGSKKGRIELEYYGNDDLETLIDFLTKDS